MLYFCMYSNLIDYWDYLNVCCIKLGQLTPLSHLVPLHCCYGNPVQAAFIGKHTLKCATNQGCHLGYHPKKNIISSSESQLEPVQIVPFNIHTYKYLHVFQPEFQDFNITNLMDDVSRGTSLVSSVIKPHHSKVFILSLAKRRRSKQCCLEIIMPSTAKEKWWRCRDKAFPKDHDVLSLAHILEL